MMSPMLKTILAILAVSVAADKTVKFVDQNPARILSSTCYGPEKVQMGTLSSQIQTLSQCTTTTTTTTVAGTTAITTTVAGTMTTVAPTTTTDSNGTDVIASGSVTTT